MTNKPTSRQLQGHFDALRARRSNVSAEVIDISAGNYGSGKTFAGVSQVSDPSWVGATATFYIHINKDDELVLNNTSGFPQLSTKIARLQIASGVIIDVIDERAEVNGLIDGYQVLFNDSSSNVATGDTVQEALESLDTYVFNLDTGTNVTKYLDFDINGGIINGNVKIGHIDDSPIIEIPDKNNGVGRVRYSVSVPADIVGNTNIIVKIFWSAETSDINDVSWQVRYRPITSGVDNVDIAMISTSYIQSTVGTADRLTDTGSNLSILSSNISPNDILVINVERVYDVNDTYDDTVRIHLVRLEYTGRGIE